MPSVITSGEYQQRRFKIGNMCVACDQPKIPMKGLVISVDFTPRMYLCEEHEKLIHNEKFLKELCSAFLSHNPR